MVDQWIVAQLLKMNDQQVFQVIDDDLKALGELKKQGMEPTCGAFKSRLDEVEAAREVLRMRL
jgi:hypothetical protein